MKTEKFIRKPFTVDAIQVTEENMEEVAKWSKGTICSTDPEIADKFKKPVQKWIQIEVQHSMNERQTKAFVGDYVLYANRGFKIYTAKAFERNFERPFKEPESRPDIKIHVGDDRHKDVPTGHPKAKPPTPAVMAAARQQEPKVIEAVEVLPTGQAVFTEDTVVTLPEDGAPVTNEAGEEIGTVDTIEVTHKGLNVTATINTNELSPAQKAALRKQEVPTEDLGGL